VHQRADGARRQLGAGVPAGEQRVDIEVGLANGDQRPVGDERADLARRQLARVLVEPDRVHVREQVAAVAVELRPLVVVHRVLHRQGMQPELFDDDLQVGGVRIVQVQPHHSLGVSRQQMADVLGGKALGRHRAVLIRPGAGSAPRWRHSADRRGGRPGGLWIPSGRSGPGTRTCVTAASLTDTRRGQMADRHGAVEWRDGHDSEAAAERPQRRVGRKDGHGQ